MREIELRPIKGERGHREIVVDAKAWGKVESFGHGCHGYSYQFLQFRDRGDSKGYWVEREDSKGRREDSKGRSAPVRFRPAKPDRYVRAVRGVKAEPLDDQLRRHVGAMIEAGELRDPEIVAAEHAESERLYHQRAVARAKTEAHEFAERARACLKPLRLLNIGTPDSMTTDLVAAIVKAMRWAQTQQGDHQWLKANASPCR